MEPVTTALICVLFFALGGLTCGLAALVIGYHAGSQRCTHNYYGTDEDDDDDDFDEFMPPQVPNDPEMAEWRTNQN